LGVIPVIVKFEPRFRSMVWGNPKLNRLFNIETSPFIGEVWLLSDLEPFVTSAVDQEKTSLKKLMKDFDMDFPRFPVLIKLVSPAQWLSIQVHPDDTIARAVENEPWGKTECWYFVEPGKIAVVPNGTVLKNCSEPSEISEHLVYLDMRAGDLFFVPAGLIHTLGPESVVVEIQQASDLTYRIYDWGRKRETHIEKASMAVKDFRIEELIHRNFEKLNCGTFSVHHTFGRTHLIGLSIVVFLKEGFVAQIATKAYETFIIADETIEGEALVVKIEK